MALASFRLLQKSTSWKRRGRLLSLPNGFRVNLVMPLTDGLGTRSDGASGETGYGLRGYPGPALVAPVPLCAHRPRYKSSFLPLTGPSARWPDQ